jgi:maltooligosyltrehalose trehalohydrolase
VEARLGATYLGERRSRFLVWAPRAGRVELVVQPGRRVEMEPDPPGYFHATVEGVEPGSLYRFRLDDGPELPDPASRFQPEGVDGPSAVVDPSALPREIEGWSGIPLDEYVIYELHVGAFSAEGTFGGMVPYLDELRDLGVTAVELMPVGQFPGTRNWGYDGVYPFAVQDSYGGPEGLARLVAECHRREMAVVLDVVYNHMGPESGRHGAFGPYFSVRRTPWGSGMNFDGQSNEGVRRYFIENALHWLVDYRIDALRLDAADRIVDRSKPHFLQELAETVEKRAGQLGRRVHLIAESHLDDPPVIESRGTGGFGIHAQWADDFHHAVHSLLTGDRTGYYKDFGGLEQLAQAYRDAFLYRGPYVPHLGRTAGSPPRQMRGERFVVYAQNHDQVGNPMFGQRLSKLVGFEELKLAAGLYLLAPFIPLVFMGEEYGEEAPFHFFVSFSSGALAEAIRNARVRDFASFEWRADPPDPGDEATFERSKLNHALKLSPTHRALWNLYRELLRLRKDVPALAGLSRQDIAVAADLGQSALVVRRWSDRDEALAVFNVGEAGASVDIPEGGWRKRVDSADGRWSGGGTSVPDAVEAGEIEMKPRSFVLLTREKVA